MFRAAIFIWSWIESWMTMETHFPKWGPIFSAKCTRLYSPLTLNDETSSIALKKCSIEFAEGKNRVQEKLKNRSEVFTIVHKLILINPFVITACDKTGNFICGFTIAFHSFHQSSSLNSLSLVHVKKNILKLTWYIFSPTHTEFEINLSVAIYKGNNTSCSKKASAGEY